MEYITLKKSLCIKVCFDETNTLKILDKIVSIHRKLYRPVSWSVGLDMLVEHPDKPVLLGEGFATMSKVYELTGLPSVAGISCSGLMEVAKALKNKYPLARIIVAADNNKATENSTGSNQGI